MLKTLKITAAALMMGMAFTAPATAQDITPEQAKTVADQFVKCSGLYAAGADLMRNSGDAESVSTAETGDAMSLQAEIAAMVLYAMFDVPGTEGIKSRAATEKANYSSLLNTGSAQVNADLETCTGMVDLQNTLVEMAQKAFDSQQSE